ncbi:MAG: helix-turn-helix domain-containing protein [bacterium]
MLTVGKILKSEREKKNLKIEDVEKEIKIRNKYLQAIENDDWRLFSSKVYIAGIIRNYSKFLDLNPDKLLAFFRREYARKEDMSFKKKISSKYLTPQTKKIITYSIVLMIFAFVYYFGYQLNRYLSPPKAEILSPSSHTFKRQDRVEIVGKTEKEAVIKIFGERIYQDDKGIFSYELPLKEGINKLTIEVEGANGKTTTLKEEYILKK